MRSNIVLATLLAATLAAAASAQGNILIIIADDLGVDNVGAYGLGSDLPNTPVIDSLAAGGVLFTNAWGHPLCTPSRAAIQTGLHPFRTGLGATAQSGGQALALDNLIVPEALDALGLGHSHAFFGKWHLSNDTVGGPAGPNLAGYSHFAGVMANLGIQPTAYFTWQKVVDGAVFTANGYITSDIVDDALSWIGEQRTPWLAFVAFNAPHAPFHAPPAHLHTVDLSGAGSPQTDKRPYYRAMIEAMDTEIGRLLTGLGNDLAQTTVIFFGDNGTPDDVIVPPFASTHCKGTAYEGGVRVPFLAAGLGVGKPGRQCHELVSVTDIFATVVDLAKLEKPRRGEGSNAPGQSPPPTATFPESIVTHVAPVPTARDSVSLMPYLRGSGAVISRVYNWAEVFVPNGFGTPTSSRRSIRAERFKLIYNVGQFDPPLPTGEFLFDLLEDPFETLNLLDAPLAPEAASALNELRHEATWILNSVAPAE